MESNKLYKQLEADFVTPKLNDDWGDMEEIEDFLTENFKERNMGVVCGFTKEEPISKVYTAVFPSMEVMQKILDEGAGNAVLFVHHPMMWDITNEDGAFQNMDRDLLEKFQERRISIFNFHVPLDNYGEYSTSVSLAKVVGIEPLKSFAEYYGASVGVFGKTELKTVNELKDAYEKVVGHKINLYNYGNNEIRNSVVAVIGGGGFEFVEDVAKENVNVLVTGITIKNNFHKHLHDFSKKNRINILGLTHYSSEKFACIAMTDYFKKLGLDSEFVSEKPCKEDM